MGKYAIDLGAPPGHCIPPLLARFGAWLARQPYGALGWFRLEARSIPREWNPAAADRLQRDGFSFMHLPDGSLLALLRTGAGGPPAVVLLGSEGDTATVASSLEEFLVLLGKGETGVDELDEEDAKGRDRLRAWLSRNKVTVPRAKSFDFDAYLDGTPATAPPAGRPGPVPEVVAGLSPLLRRVAALVGCRADDPELTDFVTNTLGKKVPPSITDVSGPRYVVAKKQGIEMAFDHDLKNEKYPLIHKSKSSYVPYLAVVWLTSGLGEPLPFGLRFGMSADEITSILGTPGEIGFGGVRRPYWKRALVPARDVVLGVEPDGFTIGVDQARELTSRHGWPARPIVGLFVAWAILRSLLNEALLAGHAALLAAVRRRQQRGSTFVDAALARGLWDVHLRDEPGLRALAYQWFHNIGGTYIRDDLVAVFGARQGPDGHTEPRLDDDDWPAVDRAAPTLDRRFAQWVKSARKKGR
jgi:hypothetical protein